MSTASTAVFEKPLLTRMLPVDPLTPEEGSDQVPDKVQRRARQVSGLFSYVWPELSEDPRLVSVSRGAIEGAGFSANEASVAELTLLTSGDLQSLTTKGSKNKLRPYASNYVGFQFGVFAGQLGDGRAITVGRTNGVDLQLKGAGRTPFSRFADGRAVLRSSIREFLASEFMHAIGVPSSRALALVTTGEPVLREDGPEPGAIVLRSAPSWLRFGSLELPFYRQDLPALTAVADLAIKQDFSDLPSINESIVLASGDTVSLNVYARLLARVVDRTALLIAHWQAIGFQHGVMNTDNMSLLGLTIDYGPFGFMDEYDPSWICNHSDNQGRYMFENQPKVALWNLSKLATAMSPLVDVDDGAVAGAAGDGTGTASASTANATESSTDDAGANGHGAEKLKVQLLQAILNRFGTVFGFEYPKLMCAKIGFFDSVDANSRSAIVKDYDEFIIPLLKIMAVSKVDYALFFRALSDHRVGEMPESKAETLIHDSVMLQCRGDKTLAESVVQDLRDWTLKYDVRLTRSTQTNTAADQLQRTQRMKSINPRYILRNWICEDVIKKTTETFFNSSSASYNPQVNLSSLGQEVDRCMRIIVNDPYGLKPVEEYSDENDREAAKRWSGPVPAWGKNLQCSCSS